MKLQQQLAELNAITSSIVELWGRSNSLFAAGGWTATQPTTERSAAQQRVYEFDAFGNACKALFEAAMSQWDAASAVAQRIVDEQVQP